MQDFGSNHHGREEGRQASQNDTRDARDIAANLAYGTCSFVHVPTAEDCAVRDYIRMRNDPPADAQRLKQQINAFDERIEELSHKPAYEVRVSQLACLCGITRKRATSIITEVCDFNRIC